MGRKVPGVTDANGKWYATAYDPVVGKKVRVRNPATGRVAFPDQAAAIRGKEEFEASKGHPRDREWTVDGWVREWTTNEGFARTSESTDLHNRERVSKLASDFAGRPLKDLDRVEARKWALANKGRVSAVRAMLNDAVADGLLQVNPFSNLRMPQSRGRRDITPLTEDEVNGLIVLADDMFPEWPVMAGVIATAAYGGLRFGEVAGLKWGDLDWAAGTIHVRRQFNKKLNRETPPKNGQPRLIVMQDIVADSLRAVERLGPDDLVFYSRRDHSRYYEALHSYFWRQVRTAFWSRLPPDRQELIGPNMEFHELRHFCGSWLADHGASAQDIAYQLGHQDGGRLAQSLYIHTYEDNAIERLRAVGSKARLERMGS